MNIEELSEKTKNTIFSINAQCTAHSVLNALGYKRLCEGVYVLGNDAVIVDLSNERIDGIWPGDFLLDALRRRIEHSFFPWNRNISTLEKRIERLGGEIQRDISVLENPRGFFAAEAAMQRDSGLSVQDKTESKEDVEKKELAAKVEAALDECFIPVNAQGERVAAVTETIEFENQYVGFRR